MKPIKHAKHSICKEKIILPVHDTWKIWWKDTEVGVTLRFLTNSDSPQTLVVDALDG